METIGERLKEVRKSIDYIKNQSDFATSIGISQASLAQIENGSTRSISKPVLMLMNLKHNINTDYIINGNGDLFNYSTSLSSDGIPLYRSEAAAGFGTAEFNIEEKDIEAKYKIKELDSASFMLHVRGDSMSPTYGNGDIIAVRTVLNIQSIQWSKPHLISSRDHGLLVKRIYDNGDTIIAVSDNSTYRPICISKDDITGLAFIMGSVRFENY